MRALHALALTVLRRLLAPTIWLSGRLSFPRKYLLIGGVVLVAFALLSVPLLRQVRQDSELARVEREGLRVLGQQGDVLATLVRLRSRSVAGAEPGTEAAAGALPPEPAADVAALVRQAREAGLAEPAERLERSWRQAAAVAGEHDAQQRFAAQNGTINALLALMRESARRYRLNVDAQLDATFELLAGRLPLVLETLGKQQDALALNTGEMASYALGAQVVLTDAVPAVRAGIAQLVDGAGAGVLPLPERLKALLQGMARQQDAADKMVGEPQALGELRAVAAVNVELARALHDGAVAAADASLRERIERLQHTQWVLAALLIGATAAIAYLFTGVYLSTVRSLKQLSDGTQAFCSGRLDTRIRLDTRDELVLVARNFNTVAAEFARLLDVIREQNESRRRELETQVAARTAELAEKNEALRAAGERVQEELQLARNMQQAILPQVFPAEPGWDVHAVMTPARELGGDFYDCFALADGRLGLVVADVSGKGVGAAFFMAVSRTVMLDQALRGLSPAQVLASANELLCERNPMELFVTACYGIYDPHTGALVYASAGHHPPLLRDAHGAVRALPCARDIALGVMPGMDYSDHTEVLAPGSTLLLYTDGVTEAFSPQGEAFGDERLRQWLGTALPDQAAAALVTALVERVAQFVAGAEASDDLTCLVLNRKQEPPPCPSRPRP